MSFRTLIYQLNMNKLMTFGGVFQIGAIAKGRALLAVFLLAPAVFATGCATATIEEAVPQEALTQSSDAEASADSTDPSTEAEIASASTGPDNTGEYPNLNAVQRGALAQMTPEEKQAYLDELRAARAGQTAAGSGSGRSKTQAELNRIARTHDENTLKEIEGEDELRGSTD